MYPSNRPYVNVDSALLRQYWLPVFDQYAAVIACLLGSSSVDTTSRLGLRIMTTRTRSAITVVKYLVWSDVSQRTYPLRNNAVSSAGNGTVYLGDGCWGRTPRAAAQTWYEATVFEKRCEPCALLLPHA